MFIDTDENKDFQLFTTLRRFPEVQQSVKHSKLMSNTLVPEIEKRRPMTANPYDIKNRKNIGSYQHKKIYSIRNEMKHLARDSVSNDLNEMTKIRLQISAIRKIQIDVLEKDYNESMIRNMNPFESACIKLCRAGLLDLKEVNVRNHARFTSAITKNVIESINKKDFKDKRSLENGNFTVDVLGNLLKANGVVLSSQELCLLHEEMCRSLFTFC